MNFLLNTKISGASLILSFLSYCSIVQAAQNTLCYQDENIVVFQDNVQPLVYYGNLEESKPSSQNQLTFLEIKVADLNTDDAQEFANMVRSAGVDMMCIRNVFMHETRHLFSLLKDHYGYFYVFKNHPQTQSSNQELVTLIVSQYPIENVHFYQFFPGCEVTASDILLSFTVKAGSTALSQIYLMQSLSNNEATESKFNFILDTMQRDYLKVIEEDAIPFILCGLDAESQNEASISAHFATKQIVDIEDGPLLLESLPDFSDYSIASGFNLTSTPFDAMVEGHAILTTLKACQIVDLYTRINEITWYDDCVILAHGRAKISTEVDAEGKTAVEGSVTVSEETEGGAKYSAGINIEVTRDSDGTINAQARSEFVIEW